MSNFKEIETATREFYTRRDGLLIAIDNNYEEACRTSRLVEAYCDGSCRLSCMAGAPVMSLGEVEPELRGLGWFAVGLLSLSAERQKDCPIFNDLSRSTESTKA